MEPRISLADLLGAVRHRIWTVLLTAAGLTIIGVVVAILLPPSYVSSARILIESQQIPSELASSTVTSSAAERLELIEQRLMTRDTLLDLIDRLGLFAGRDDLTPGEKVDRIRDATRFDRITLGEKRRATRVAAFVLSYRAADPREAAAVTNELVTLVLEQNLQARSARATETLRFFRKEVARLHDALVAVETEISRFKEAHRDALPASLEFRRAERAELRDRRFELKRRQISLEERLALLDAPATASAAPRDETAAALRAQLAQARGLYAESHPRIRAIEAQLAALNSADEAAAEAAKGAARPDPATLRAREETLIRSELDLIADELAEADSRAAALDLSIAETPTVAVELAALERRYQSLSAQYQSAIAKQAAAETGEKLEVNRQAERFEVIEAAQVPDTPDAPNRTLVMAGGAVGGIGLGLGLAIFLDLVSSTVRTAAQLERRLALRPLAVIPTLTTARAARRKRWQRRIVAAGVLAAIGLGAAYVDREVEPLSVIADKIAEKTGASEFLHLIEQRLRP